MVDLLFPAPKNVTTLPQMLQYINSLTDVNGNGGVLGILFLVIIGAILFLMTKGYGNERAFGISGLSIGILAILLKAMGLINNPILYVCIFLAIIGIYLIIKEASNYEQ